MKPQSIGRLIVATLAAAGATALLPCLTIVGIIFAPFVFIVAIAHAAIIGFPIALICNHRGWITSLSTILGGGAIGAVPISLLSFPDFMRGYGSAMPFFALIFGAFGAIGGVSFWITLSNMARRDTETDFRVFE